jgi:hypothetical protein
LHYRNAALTWRNAVLIYEGARRDKISPTRGEIVRAGQRIRLRPASRAAREWNIAPDAEGTVICRYRILASGPAAPDRLDVRFSPQKVIWGAPAVEFEEIGDTAENKN